MKREDETLLQYLIRLAKEGGEDFAEGYGELANQRLIRSRPDVARKRGLMPDQIMAGEFEGIDQIPSVAPDSLLPPQVTDTAGADRATIEQMSTQRSPVFLDKGVTSLTDMMNYQPTLDRDLTGLETARIPEVVDPSKQVTTQGIMDYLPGEDIQDQNLIGLQTDPATARVPAAGLSQENLHLVLPKLLDQYMKDNPGVSRHEAYKIITEQPSPGVQPARTADIAKDAEEGGWPWDTAWFEGLKDIGLKVGGPMVKQAEVQRIGAPALVERARDLVTETTPERDARITQEQSDIALNLREGYISGAITEETQAQSKLGFFERINRIVKGDPEPKTIDQEWNPDGDGKLARLLGKTKVVSKVIKEAPVSDSVSVIIERAKKNVGSGKTATTTSDKPTFFGHSSKEDFLRAAGILGGDKRSLDFTERMDKIDSDSRMFDMIAMLGGAGDSRVGSNFRNKSYQRLKLEFDMDQNEWDRNFKIMAHPWVTYYWHDPNAGIPPKSVPQGMGVGPGWQRQPTTRDKGTTRTQNYDALLAEYDGSEASEDLIALRYVNEFASSGGFLTPEEETERGYAFLNVAIPLPNNGKRWTPAEKKQVLHAISAGNREAVEEMIDSKNYIPPSLRQAIDEFFKSGIDESPANVPSRKVGIARVGG